MRWTKAHSRNAADGSFLLYCLSRKSGREIRYFGITKQSPDRRMYGHIRDVKIGQETYKTRWIKSVLNSGDEIKMIIIKANLTSKEAADVETRMIRFFKTAFRLTNTSEGGNTGGKTWGFVADVTINIKYKGNPIARYAVKKNGRGLVSKNGDRSSIRGVSREIESILINYKP